MILGLGCPLNSIKVVVLGHPLPAKTSLMPPVALIMPLGDVLLAAAIPQTLQIEFNFVSNSQMKAVCSSPKLPSTQMSATQNKSIKGSLVKNTQQTPLLKSFLGSITQDHNKYRQVCINRPHRLCIHTHCQERLLKIYTCRKHYVM